MLSFEIQLVEVPRRARNGHLGNFWQVAAFDKNVARIPLQPCAIAVGTDPETEIAGQFRSHALGIGFVVTAHDVRHDAFERLLSIDAHAAAADVTEIDFLALAAVQDDVLPAPVETPEGRGEIKSVVSCQGFKLGEIPEISRLPAANRAFGQAVLGIDDDTRFVEELTHAEAVAGRAGASGVVEGK